MPKVTSMVRKSDGFRAQAWYSEEGAITSGIQACKQDERFTLVDLGYRTAGARRIEGWRMGAVDCVGGIVAGALSAARPLSSDLDDRMGDVGELALGERAWRCNADPGALRSRS